MTNDGDALFRAICESPADDTARLVYADWLEENGNPERAEFIRLQCEASYISPAFPDLTERRNRASQLFKKFGHRWDVELPEPADVTWGSLYVRGFIDTVTVTDSKSLSTMLQLVFALAPLQYLTILSSWPGHLEELLLNPRIGRLSQLRIFDVPNKERYLRLLTEARLRFPNTEIQ